MSTADNPETSVESTHGDTVATAVPQSDPTLEAWRSERRALTTQTSSDWRSAVPAELFERIRARSAAAAFLASPPLAARVTPASWRLEATEASAAPLPTGYRAPYLPVPAGEPEAVVESLGWDTDAELLPEEAPFTKVPSSFLGLEWSSADPDDQKVLVSVRPVLSPELADRVVELLDRAPGMSSVKSIGSEGDVAAFTADYDGPIDRMEAVSQALKGIGASLVSTGDREFYLAIQGQAV